MWNLASLCINHEHLESFYRTCLPIAMLAALGVLFILWIHNFLTWIYGSFLSRTGAAMGRLYVLSPFLVGGYFLFRYLFTC